MTVESSDINTTLSINFIIHHNFLLQVQSLYYIQINFTIRNSIHDNNCNIVVIILKIIIIMIYYILISRHAK